MQGKLVNWNGLPALPDKGGRNKSIKFQLFKYLTGCTNESFSFEGGICFFIFRTNTHDPLRLPMAKDLCNTSSVHQNSLIQGSFSFLSVNATFHWSNFYIKSPMWAFRTAGWSLLGPLTSLAGCLCSSSHSASNFSFLSMNTLGGRR